MSENTQNLKNIKLTIEYDGTGYSGWQSQINAIAIADVLKSAIEKLCGEEIKLTGASRTDAGVHAYGQVANFVTTSRIPSEKFSFAINNNLPSDIVVVNSTEVPIDFHSRYWAKGKTYIYNIYNSRFPSALMQNRVNHVAYNLDFDAMKIAAIHFIGTHDFEAFRSVGCSAKSSIKTIKSLDLRIENSIITIEITGDGFLYNMVRIIAGTLVHVGLGKIKAEKIPFIINSKDRRQAGKTAPSCGLYLKELFY